MTPSPTVSPASVLAPSTLSLGLWAPSLREQGFDALLPAEDVDAFMADDTAISRLHARGVISYSAHIKAREKLASKIKAALRSAARLASNPGGGER